MNGKQIQALRHALGETVDAFGKRFHRSGRTMQGWESGRFRPDPLALDILASLARASKGRK